jgi:sirohydrochlorin ferrochelatase
MNFTRLAEFSCVLVDNGSLNPAATLNLRDIAAKLEKVVGHRVEPVSLLHSDKVPPAELSGLSAETLEPFLGNSIKAGRRQFLVLPFFLGPSAALTDFIPQRIAGFRETTPDLKVAIASPLVRMGEPQDNRVARILADNVRKTIQSERIEHSPTIVLVDHGSPQPAVAAVRDHVVSQLAAELGDAAKTVLAASMERRDGSEYDFNEPLLERALRGPPCGPETGDVVVAMMFLSPGRHAGTGGDVAQICSKAELECRGLKTHRTQLIGDHPMILEILADRFRQTIRQF